MRRNTSRRAFVGAFPSARYFSNPRAKNSCARLRAFFISASNDFRETCASLRIVSTSFAIWGSTPSMPLNSTILLRTWCPNSWKLVLLFAVSKNSMTLVPSGRKH